MEGLEEYSRQKVTKDRKDGNLVITILPPPLMRVMPLTSIAPMAIFAAISLDRGILSLSDSNSLLVIGAFAFALLFGLLSSAWLFWNKSVIYLTGEKILCQREPIPPKRTVEILRKDTRDVSVLEGKTKSRIFYKVVIDTPKGQEDLFVVLNRREDAFEIQRIIKDHYGLREM